MTLTFDLDLGTFHDRKGLVQLSQCVEGGVNIISSFGVVVENDVKKGVLTKSHINKLTNKLTNQQTNQHKWLSPFNKIRGYF